MDCYLELFVSCLFMVIKIKIFFDELSIESKSFACSRESLYFIVCRLTL